MDHGATGEGFSCCLVTDDEMIVAKGQQRLRKCELTVSRFLRTNFVFGGEKDDFSEAFRCAQMDSDPLMILDSLCRRGSDFQERIQSVGGQSELFVTNDMSPFD